MDVLTDSDKLLTVALVVRRHLREFTSGDIRSSVRLAALLAHVSLELVAFNDAPEDCLQVVCVHILGHPEGLVQGSFLAHHSPNGEKRSPVTGKKLKIMGVRSGWPDLDVRFIDRLGQKRAVLIELKTLKGKLSSHQNSMHTDLKALGQEVITCKGLAHFLHCIVLLAQGYDAEHVAKNTKR